MTGTMIALAPSAVERCWECDRLWKDCNEALEEYLNVLAERNAARKRKDLDLVEAFEGIENDSLAKCQNARQAILDHETTHNLEGAGKEILATELLTK